MATPIQTPRTEDGYSLSDQGRVMRDMFNNASKLFDDGEFEDSETLCRQLLTYADLGDYHRAGCHRILSLSEDNFLWHAEQAVDLYENLFVVRPGGSYTGVKPPTPEQIASQQNLLDLARKNLELAKRDHQEIQADFAEQFKRFEAAHGRQPTRRELAIADMRRYANDENGVDEQLDISADNWNVYLAADDAAQSEEAASPPPIETTAINAADQDMEIAGQKDQNAVGQEGEAAAADTEREEVEVEGRDDMNLDFPITPP